jgi:hypothetical protein
MAPKDCRDLTTDYHPARTTDIRVILTDGDMPVTASQCFVLKTQEVTRFHYGLFKVAINQPVEGRAYFAQTPQTVGKIHRHHRHLKNQ